MKKHEHSLSGPAIALAPVLAPLKVIAFVGGVILLALLVVPPKAAIANARTSEGQE